MGHITLLSDFGLQDATVAIAKGILMQHAPGMIITDITHEIDPFNIKQASYILGATYDKFPPDTFHVVLFDLFYQRNAALTLCRHHDRYLLAPDNGIVPMALKKQPEHAWLYETLDSNKTFADWLHRTGDLIHSLNGNKDKINDLQPYGMKTTDIPEPVVSDKISCEIIHIDQYENVVLDMTRERFEHIRNGRQFRLQFMQVEEINEISNNYNEARAGYKLCRFNRSGHMEICINRGKAASLFGLRTGSRNNDIKILFE